MSKAVEESIRDIDELSSRYALMDDLLGRINKTRKTIPGDGHCLPRAVYQGATYIQQQKRHTTYKSLFRECIDFFAANYCRYSSFIEEGETLENAVTQLNKYFLDRTYAEQDVPSVSIDLLINIMCEVTNCQIFVILVILVILIT